MYLLPKKSAAHLHSETVIPREVELVEVSSRFVIDARHLHMRPDPLGPLLPSSAPETVVHCPQLLLSDGVATSPSAIMRSATEQVLGSCPLCLPLRRSLPPGRDLLWPRIGWPTPPGPLVGCETLH